MSSEMFLKDLGERVSKGFDLLMERETKGPLDARYERWFRDWVKLLRQYEAELDRGKVTA